MARFDFVAPEQANLFVPLSTMLANVWQDDPSFYQSEYLGNSHYDPRVSRLALLGEDIVSHWGVWTYDMRVGSVLLKTGGVGAVATREDMRRQGLMRQTGDRSLSAMRQAGYDISVLHGYTDNYAHFGFVRAWTYTEMDVDLDTLLVQKALTLIPVDLNRDHEAIALYNQTHRGFTGTAVRPTYYGLTNRRAYGWIGDQGELAGYVLMRHSVGETVLHCLEAVGPVEDLLSVLRQLAEREGCESIVFETLPPRHPLCIRLRRETAKDNDSFSIAVTAGWCVQSILPKHSTNSAMSFMLA